MKSFLKDTAKHTFVYGIGSILQSAIGFFLLPLYLHYLTPSDYGILALLSVLSMLFGSLILQGIPTALFRSFSYDYLDKPDQQKEAVGSAYLYLLIFPFVLYGTLWLLAPQISNITFKGSGPVFLVRLIFLTGFFGASSNVLFVVLRARLKSKTTVFISILRGIINISFNIYFVVVLNLKVAGIVWGNLITEALMFLVTPILLRKDLVWKISYHKLKEMLLFGWPLMPGAIAMWILASADRYFLEHFSTTAELGLYSLGFRIATVITIILLDPFRLAWPAVFYPEAKKEGATLAFSRFSTYFLLISGGVGLMLILGAEPLIKLMGPSEYWSAHRVVPIIIFSVIIGNEGLQSIIGIGWFIKKKTHFAPIVVGVGAVANIVLNWLFVPAYGMMGAAIATLLSSVIMLFTSQKIVSYFYPIKFELRRVSMLATIAILITILNYLPNIEPFLLNISYKLLLFLLYPILLYITGFFTEEEKSIIKNVREGGLKSLITVMKST